MSRLRFCALIPITVLISACSTTLGDWDGGGWNENPPKLQSNQYIAPDGSVQTYQTPRKYHITTEDMEKYDAINDRVAKRRMEIQQKQEDTTNSSLTYTAPSATYNPYSSQASNNSSVDQGKTNSKPNN